MVDCVIFDISFCEIQYFQVKFYFRNGNKKRLIYLVWVIKSTIELFKSILEKVLTNDHK